MMSKRHYLMDIVGEGSEENTFRVFIDGLGLSYSASMPCDPTTGVPLQSWALTQVSAADHSVLDGYAQIDALLNRPLETLVAGLTSAELAHLDDVFAKRQIEASFMVTAVDYAAVLKGIGVAADPSFDGDVSDLA